MFILFVFIMFINYILQCGKKQKDELMQKG